VRATAIIPVKHFAAAKRRLADALGHEARVALAAAMLGDVLDAVVRSESIRRTIVVTGEPEAERAASEQGAEVVPDPHDAGHSEAASSGVARALELGAECAVLLPGDCPLLDPRELDAALERVSTGRVGIVPDRHGTGTNALLLAPPDAIAPSFGEGSRERHGRLVGAAGLDAALEPLDSLALDLDTPDDLATLREVLRAAPDRAPRTAAALQAHVPA
jgi:2-phospho-L-lactate/phosphoenolpyruvate guanylyltransferase